MYNFRKFEKRDKPYKFVTLSFDDCVMQDVRFINLLRKYGMLCTFNLNSAMFGWTDTLDIGGRSVNHFHVLAEDVANVYNGFEVASHSCTHPRLDLLSREKLIDEIAGDVKTIEQLTTQKVIGMAYPGGPYYNDDVIKIICDTTDIFYARDTYSTYGFDLPKKEELMTWHPTCHFIDNSINDVINKFAINENMEDALLYIWGHTYEFDFWNNWNLVEEILQAISKLEGVTFATNGEIADYIVRTK